MAEINPAAVAAKGDEVESLVRRLAEACREYTALNARQCLENALSESQLSLPMEKPK